MSELGRAVPEATPVGTASPPVRRRCDFVCVTMVACVASATSLRSHNNCHMEFLCASEGAYPLWPKPGRLSAGLCRSAHRLPRVTCAQFCCAYFVTAASFLPVQGMGYPAACATLIRAAMAQGDNPNPGFCGDRLSSRFLARLDRVSSGYHA